MTLKRLCAALSMMAALPCSAQVPPPPPLPGQDALAARLMRAITHKDLDAYAALLSDAVRVDEDGRQVASNKAEWLNRYGPKLAAKGVTFRIVSGFSSTPRLLFVEYYNSAASWGGLPRHCCWSYDAVAYDIRDDKVIAIHRLRGGDRQVPIDGQPGE